MRSRGAMMVAAVAIAFVLGADIVAVALHDSEDDAPSEAVSALDAALPELVAFVEQSRGLRFKQPPNVELLTSAEFNARLVDEGGVDESDGAEEEAYLGFLRALGLIDDDVNLDSVVEEQLDYIVGFYDTEAKALFVRGTVIDAYAKSVIVHELTHALDDQHFNLDRQDLVDDDAAAFEALVEGSAVVVEQRWFDSRPSAEQAAIEEAEAGVGGQVPEDEAEPETADVFTRLLSFPYAVGPRFVDEVLRAGSQTRLDAAFVSPPATSEQVLHPERFLAGEAARSVAEPAPDGQEIERGSLGELGLILMLDGPVEHDTALRAAAGWGGDRYVSWLAGARTCVRWNLVMDTARDTTEVVNALRTWAAGNPGATVRGTNPVVVTSCG